MKRSDIKQWCRIDRAVLKLALSRPTPLMALFEEPDRTQESRQMKKPDPAPVPVFDDFVVAVTEHFADFDGIFGDTEGPKLLVAASADCYALAHAMVRAVQHKLDLEEYMNSVMKRQQTDNLKTLASLRSDYHAVQTELGEYVARGSKGDPLSK